MFRPGTHELIVGTVAQFKYRGVSVGDKVTMPDGQWPIVGMFSSGDLLDGGTGRRYRNRDAGDTLYTTYNTIVARLAEPSGLRRVPQRADHQSRLDGGCDAPA